jgi:hypothetical protein
MSIPGTVINSQRIDENRPAIGQKRQIMRIQIARHPAAPRRVKRVMILIGGRSGRARRIGQQIAKAPDLRERGDMQRIRADMKPHATRQAAFKHGKPAIGARAEQQELSSLIGGDRKAAAQRR